MHHGQIVLDARQKMVYLQHLGPSTETAFSLEDRTTRLWNGNLTIPNRAFSSNTQEIHGFLRGNFPRIWLVWPNVPVTIEGWFSSA